MGPSVLTTDVVQYVPIVVTRSLRRSCWKLSCYGLSSSRSAWGCPKTKNSNVLWGNDRTHMETPGNPCFGSPRHVCTAQTSMNACCKCCEWYATRLHESLLWAKSGNMRRSMELKAWLRIGMHGFLDGHLGCHRCLIGATTSYDFQAQSTVWVGSASKTANCRKHTRYVQPDGAGCFWSMVYPQNASDFIIIVFIVVASQDIPSPGEICLKIYMILWSMMVGSMAEAVPLNTWATRGCVRSLPTTYKLSSPTSIIINHEKLIRCIG